MDDTGMLYPVDSQTSKKVFLNPECKQYMPEQCALTKEAGPAEKPYCHNGNGISKDCNFDTAFLKDCPLPEKGDHRSIPHPISGTLRTAHFHPIRQLPVPWKYSLFDEWLSNLPTHTKMPQPKIERIWVFVSPLQFDHPPTS
jgi:hypothetical protein